VPDTLGEVPAKDKDIIIGSTGVAREEPREFAIAPANADTRRGLASVVMLAEIHAQEVHHRLLHGQLHALSSARFEALDIRRQNANGRVQASPRITYVGGRFEWWPVWHAGEAVGTRHGLRNHVEALIFAVGARRAKAFDAGVDDARVNLLDHIVAQAKIFNRPWGVIFHHDVRLAQQFFTNRQTFRRL